MLTMDQVTDLLRNELTITSPMKTAVVQNICNEVSVQKIILSSTPGNKMIDKRCAGCATDGRTHQALQSLGERSSKTEY